MSSIGKNFFSEMQKLCFGSKDPTQAKSTGKSQEIAKTDLTAPPSSLPPRPKTDAPNQPPSKLASTAQEAKELAQASAANHALRPQRKEGRPMMPLPTLPPTPTGRPMMPLPAGANKPTIATQRSISNAKPEGKPVESARTETLSPSDLANQKLIMKGEFNIKPDEKLDAFVARINAVPLPKDKAQVAQFNENKNNALDIAYIYKDDPTRFKKHMVPVLTNDTTEMEARKQEFNKHLDKLTCPNELKGDFEKNLTFLRENARVTIENVKQDEGVIYSRQDKEQINNFSKHLDEIKPPLEKGVKEGFVQAYQSSFDSGSFDINTFKNKVDLMSSTLSGDQKTDFNKTKLEVAKFVVKEELKQKLERFEEDEGCAVVDIIKIVNEHFSSTEGLNKALDDHIIKEEADNPYMENADLTRTAKQKLAENPQLVKTLQDIAKEVSSDAQPKPTAAAKPTQAPAEATQPAAAQAKVLSPAEQKQRDSDIKYFTGRVKEAQDGLNNFPDALTQEMYRNILELSAKELRTLVSPEEYAKIINQSK